MKQPKKLTRDQKACVSAYSLNVNEWMLASESEFYIKIVHKRTGQFKMLDKFRR